MLKRLISEKIILKKTDKKLAPKEAKKQKTDKQYRGQAAEDLAKMHLLKQGLTFIEKNYHCRHGEIDLIFKDNDSIIFVEVRYRRQLKYGSACESINQKKQRKIIKTAKYYLYYNHLTESVISRFDVIGITPSKINLKTTTFSAHNDCTVIQGDDYNEYNIEWIKNAFQDF